MNPSELSKQIFDQIREKFGHWCAVEHGMGNCEPCQKILGSITDVLQKDIDGQTPKCNRCGQLMRNGPALGASIKWGYESTGKDTDLDNWSLCDVCSVEFSKFAPISCHHCKKSIREVMADLASRNHNCTFFGDYERALAHYETGRHCGLEYAQVGDHILCEICYEEFTDAFTIPMPDGEYGIWDGHPIKGVQSRKKGRIASHLAPHHHYEEIWAQDLKEIRANKENKHRLFIKATVLDDKQEFILHTGKHQRYRVPFSWFTPNAVVSPSFNPEDIALIDWGQTLKLGKYQAALDRIFSEFKPEE